MSVLTGSTCFPSYSIILLEIATRSDPVPVSPSPTGPSCVQLLAVCSEVHHHTCLQAEESNVESAWCPPLPELISSKADSTCPCPADYVEV